MDIEDTTPLVRRFLRDDGLRTPSEYRMWFENEAAWLQIARGVILSEGKALVYLCT
jgi:hypothetical protein